MEINASAYLFWMAGSCLISFGLFLLFAKGIPRKPAFTFTALLLSVFFGAVCSKLLYYLFRLDFIIAESGWLSYLTDTAPESFSFFGGAAGVCAGMALTAKLFSQKPADVLNSFAPFGLLLAALARFGEYFLGMLGTGAYVENEALCFFPLSVGFRFSEDWTEWYQAVFVAEGAVLLLVALLSALRFRKHRFLRSAFWMCLPQILLENLLSGSMMIYTFIRAEQLACMIAMFVILILYGVRARGQRFRWVPAVMALLSAGIFILSEFAMDGKIAFLQFMDLTACYGLMAFGQLLLAVAEITGFRRLLRAEGTEVRA